MPSCLRMLAGRMIWLELSSKGKMPSYLRAVNLKDVQASCHRSQGATIAGISTPG